ncbi:ERC protein 2 isoform X7 [Denticeps clupeoides]|uniref:ERC protein 2 isoform X7 n=1 Tax=Denticeps clupeoides TaxID=299321 RepID=UPI0010A43553|nr:ERC protein 2 isoform X7 [Denticeps clupeoides]
MYGSARSVGQVEGSPGRSPRLPRSPRMGHRRVGGGGSGGGGGKTLSMENIQSLNAAYAASGPVYLSDHEALASSAYPKSTMTLGRATSRPSYSSRVMGSTPNIATDHVSYGDHGSSSTMHLHSLQQRAVSPLLRQVVRGGTGLGSKEAGLDMQAHLRELQRENNLLRQELEIKDNKLGTSVNSIKSFWSPELKKERELRKEGAARTSVLKEQLRVTHDDNQALDTRRSKHLQMTIQALQDELRTQRDLNQLLQQEGHGAALEHLPLVEPTEENFHQLQAEHERQAKELFLLRKTLEEMEMRIEAQKQTLGARDESIKKLLEMLQSKGLPGAGLDDDESLHLREIDQLKQELSKKESELLALQTKLETLTNQNSDCKQHIEVLKESLTAKEQRANILQTEVDALRMRLEEKESFLNKKSQQLQDLTEEKGTLNGEIRDMKDMLDVKERKINVLQKKIENLQEQLKDKERQLGSLRERVKSLQTDSSNTDTALATLEEALSEKEKIIERLKEQREREGREKLEEVDMYKRENKELKDRLASLQNQLSDKESSLIELKEQASTLASVSLKMDSKLKSLEVTVEQKKEECSKLEDRLQKALGAEEVVRRGSEVVERVRVLEQELLDQKDESGRARGEVDRLVALLRDAETERSIRDQRIAELERQAKLPSMKPTQLADKRRDGLTEGPPPAQLNFNQGAAQATVDRIRELERALRDSMNTSAHREALWVQEEQARTAAQRELEDLMSALEKTRQELDVTKQRLSVTQNSLVERDGHVQNLRQERRKQLEEILDMKQQALLAAISEKDANIALLELSASKKKKTQEEVMALKREKDRLMHQLKQQTQSRMKLMADHYDDGYHHPVHPHHPPHPHAGHHRPPAHAPPHTNHRTPPDQDDEEGIWA